MALKLMITTDFIPVDYDYFDFEGRNYAKIIGRNSKGKRVCVIDSCHIYLWAILKDDLKKDKIKKLTEKIKEIKLDIKGRQTHVESVELHDKNFIGKKVSNLLKLFLLFLPQCAQGNSACHPVLLLAGLLYK